MARTNIIQPYSLFGGTGRSVFYSASDKEVVIPEDSLMNVIVFNLTSAVTQTFPNSTVNGTEITLRNDTAEGALKVTAKAGTGYKIIGETSIAPNSGAVYLLDLSSKSWIFKQKI